MPKYKPPGAIDYRVAAGIVQRRRPRMPRTGTGRAPHGHEVLDRWYTGCRRRKALLWACAPEGTWPEWIRLSVLLEEVIYVTKVNISRQALATFLREAMPGIETRKEELTKDLGRGTAKKRWTETAYRVGPYLTDNL